MGPIVVVLAGLSDGGQVGCTLYGSAVGYPTDPGAALQRRWCPVIDRGATCGFDPVVGGTFAVACFHDRNGSGTLDFGLFGIPSEPTVASNHARGFLGPPSFADAAFPVVGPTTLHLTFSL